MENNAEPIQNPEPTKKKKVQEEKSKTTKTKVETKAKTKKVVSKSKTTKAETKAKTKKVAPKSKTTKVETKAKTKKVAPKSKTTKVETKAKTKKVAPKSKTTKVETKKVVPKSKTTVAEKKSTEKTTGDISADTSKKTDKKSVAIDSDMSKPEAKSKSKTKSKSSEKQISGEEKESIILMLHEKNGDGSNVTYNDADIEHFNKQELVEIMENVVKEKDISIIKGQVSKINAAFYQFTKEENDAALRDFISSGGKEEDFEHKADPLQVRFDAALSVYRNNKLKFSQDLEKQKKINLQLKHDLLEELKNLVNSEETLKKTYDEFRSLQDRWKAIGMVPASDLRNLWQSYHFLVEKFFDKVRINRELRDLDLKKNMEAKIVLCENAEKLLVEKSILKSFKLLQHYHDKWREIGPVPSDVKEDVWERFKATTEKINQRRKEYYKELQDQQQGNYTAKLALCDRAKEIADEPVETLKGWQSSTNKMNELLKLWKTIGRAPKSKNDEIWSTFKGYLDSFFGSKREYLSELKEQQLNNYNLKLEIITKAEEFKGSSDWSKATKELINLQKEWKAIGPVPRKYSDKIWKRFRAMCDEFFNRKSSHFKGIHASEDDNLKKKKDLVKNVASFKVTKDKDSNLTALKEFQKQWMEIGFVPFKDKEKVQNEYRSAIDELISKMDVNKTELSASDFKNKVDLLKSSPDAGKRISKERAFISGKVRKMKEDLGVWENNIGFFSSSKQSNKLKEEFERKIQKAKGEIDALKARLRMLDAE
ncbi:MAG: DNA primase [Lentimicrobiaceae bacterium]|nr:DNA primase [Lentimicrobiaceae bacterium]